MDINSMLFGNNMDPQMLQMLLREWLKSYAPNQMGQDKAGVTGDPMNAYSPYATNAFALSKVGGRPITRTVGDPPVTTNPLTRPSDPTRTVTNPGTKPGTTVTPGTTPNRTATSPYTSNTMTSATYGTRPNTVAPNPTTTTNPYANMTPLYRDSTGMIHDFGDNPPPTTTNPYAQYRQTRPNPTTTRPNPTTPTTTPQRRVGNVTPFNSANTSGSVSNPYQTKSGTTSGGTPLGGGWDAWGQRMQGQYGPSQQHTRNMADLDQRIGQGGGRALSRALGMAPGYVDQRRTQLGL